MKNIPAFPEIKTEYNESTHEYTNNTYSIGGMSLRDYFAAMAIDEMLRRCNEITKLSLDVAAHQSYAAADSMMEARGE